MKNILFVCVENACRSQMAQAFAKIHSKDIHGIEYLNVYSAGSRPSGVVNPKAIVSMKELGYDLSQHDSKSLNEIPDLEYDFVATMGCGDACPYVRATQREDWAIPDPKHMEADEFIKIRDLIEQKVKNILTGLLN